MTHHFLEAAMTMFTDGQVANNIEKGGLF